MQDDIAPCIKKDYVAVVGTSEYFPILSRNFPYIDRQALRAGGNNILGAAIISGGGQAMQGGRAENIALGQEIMEEGQVTWNRNRDRANKMMFAAQAVRGLRVNAGGADYRTLIYFTPGYTAQQRAAIAAAGAKHASPGRTFAISTTDDLINKLNESAFAGDSCARRIWRMDMYTHGVPDDLAFGYNGRNAGSRSFTAAHAGRLSRERFELHGGVAGRIYSWGCQTARANSGAHGGLAQALSNATGATVYAYARRTEYTRTWDTGTQTADEGGLVEIVSSGSRVLWHPDGARGGVGESASPAGNPAGQFTFVPR
jgi:hypothetical protein